MFAEGETVIDQTTFLGNWDEGLADGVGGIVMQGGGTVSRTIVVSTTGGRTCSTPNVTWVCSNLFGNAGGDEICGVDGGDNFSADPQFCATDPLFSRHFGLQQDSPCAPGNHPSESDCGQIGAGSVACAAVSTSHSSWSHIKRLYR